jgi:hypothetical protein
MRNCEFLVGIPPVLKEQIAMMFKSPLIGAVAAAAMVAAPVSPASAHGYYRHGGGPIFGLAALAGAAVVGAAAIATAPFRALAAPGYYGPPRAAYYAPGYYAAPPPQYYPPQYYAPQYYAPPPAYYAPPGYYGR